MLTLSKEEVVRIEAERLTKYIWLSVLFQK